MKNKFVMAVALTAMIAAAVMVPNAMAGNGGNGNGAPSGPHYNLNLIGVDKNNNNGLPQNNCGNVIFVNLYGKSTIWLNESNNFAVVDCDATDHDGGVFDLPAPNNTYNPDGTWAGPGNYTVWARAVGTPGGNGNITTCATDPSTNETVCNTNYLITRTKGKSTFADVTKQLTTVTYYNTALGKNVTVDIFDQSLYGYFWSYDNNGLKVVQLRFYPTSK